MLDHDGLYPRHEWEGKGDVVPRWTEGAMAVSPSQDDLKGPPEGLTLSRCSEYGNLFIC